MINDTTASASMDEPKTKDGDYSAGAKAMIGAVMPCGACVTNVYEAYRAGERAALARAPLPAYRDGQEPLTVDDYQAKLLEVFIASFRAGPEGGKLVPSEEMARFYFKHVVQPAQGELLEVEKLEMLIHEITGYEGEDDAFTYLRRALSELMECRAKADAAPAQADDARDAARYRWLRDKSEPGICAFYLSVGQAFKNVKFARETVDEAIDAQIAAMSRNQDASIAGGKG